MSDGNHLLILYTQTWDETGLGQVCSQGTQLQAREQLGTRGYPSSIASWGPKRASCQIVPSA